MADKNLPKSSQEPSNSLVSELQDLYETSKRILSNGQRMETLGDMRAARKYYSDTLKSLETTGVKLDGLSNKSSETVKNMQEKILEMKQVAQTYLTKIDDNKEVLSSQEPNFATAVELLRIPDGVQLFAVGKSLEVQAAPSSCSNSLVVFTFEEIKQPDEPEGFIQVGEWMYPLKSGRSPVLHCSNGAYIFPNVTTKESSSEWKSIGLVLSADLDPEYDENFRKLLQDMAALQEQSERLESEPSINLRKSVSCNQGSKKPIKPATHDSFSTTTSKQIASGIETGAEWISWGVTKGAGLTVGLIQKGATQIKRSIKPNEQPTQVRATIQKSLELTNEVAKTTVKVSGVVVKGLSEITNEIADKVSPHLTPIIYGTKSSQRSSKKEAAKRVATAGFQGVGTVWSSLEDAGMAIAQAVSTAVIETVDQKYGSEIGLAASQVASATGNLGKAAIQLNNLGVKHIAKKTAGQVGSKTLKEVVKQKIN